MSSAYLAPHIVVMVHGNNGSPVDFDPIAEALSSKYSDDASELLIIQSGANHQQTSMGVEAGGAKLAEEIVETVCAFELSPSVTKYHFSIVGHSLGGLYARYAIAKVVEQLSDLLSNVEFVSFITLCTPHLGSRRARGPSGFKNFLRMGVHTVLASKNIFGSTGIDLLLEAQPTSTAAEEEAKEAKLSLLEAMSEPGSAYVAALKRFNHCTLVAMTDGDVVVPFPSASIRNFSPYPSYFLTKQFAAWRWHLRHFGFTDPSIVKLLDTKVDPELVIEHPTKGMDVVLGPRYESVAGFECDNKQEVEFPYAMIFNQQQAVPWRRIDLNVEPSGVMGKFRLHDWSINKMQAPDCLSLEWIDVLCEVIGSDHGLKSVDTDAQSSSVSAPVSPSAVDNFAQGEHQSQKAPSDETAADASVDAAAAATAAVPLKNQDVSV